MSRNQRVSWNQREQQTKPAPSPLVGEGWGGGSLLLHEMRPLHSTPTPNPSPQGGGEPRRARGTAEPHRRNIAFAFVGLLALLAATLAAADYPTRPVSIVV